MPLTRRVTFQGPLQKRHRVQIAKLIRWEFKMEPDQVLRIGVNAANLGRGWQFFFGKMRKGGFITIPKITLSRIQKENESLIGHLFEVTLEPV